MGSWTLHIAGHGVHDNGLPEDVDLMVKQFVKDLKAAGHHLDAAHLNVGAGRSLYVGAGSDDEINYRTF
jgi:hypothetical protein